MIRLGCAEDFVIVFVLIQSDLPDWYIESEMFSLVKKSLMSSVKIVGCSFGFGCKLFQLLHNSRKVVFELVVRGISCSSLNTLSTGLLYCKASSMNSQDIDPLENVRGSKKVVAADVAQ